MNGQRGKHTDIIEESLSPWSNEEMLRESASSHRRNRNSLLWTRRRQGINLRGQRTRFALFLKILTRRLESCEEFDMLQQVKFIINFYTKRKQSVMRYQEWVNYCLLIDCMERPIRAVVGEQHWIRSHRLMNHYIASKQQAKRARLIRQESPKG